MHLCNFVPRGTDCFIMGLKDFVFRAQTATLREDVEGGNNSNMLGFLKIVFVLFVCLFVCFLMSMCRIFMLGCLFLSVFCCCFCSVRKSPYALSEDSLTFAFEAVRMFV